MRGRTVVNAAADAAALVDHLGAERFLVAGWSGGGPRWPMRLLPDRVRAAVTMAAGRVDQISGVLRDLGMAGR
jgi:pimeloyl-ACP methyl ester carboxylesterase